LAATALNNRPLGGTPLYTYCELLSVPPMQCPFLMLGTAPPPARKRHEREPRSKPFRGLKWSPIGTYRTFRLPQWMFALGGKADIERQRFNVC
jgi:hypothetical protein